jgi:uncharacterized coiled-coil protein SlyX
MKAYQIKNLQERIANQEATIKGIERNLQFAHIKPYRKIELENRLAKEVRVLNLMKKAI